MSGFWTEMIGQESLKIGQWQTHYSFHDAQYIANGGEYVYYGNEQGILKIHKESREIERISTTDGLNEAGMGELAYDPYNQVLIASYFNGNIDLLDSNEKVTNIPSIATNNAPIDKTIYHINPHSDTLCYISMGFGLKILDVKNQEFGDETRAGLAFYQTAIAEDYLYAATPEGVYRLPLNASANIQDFSAWEHLGASFDLPNEYSTYGITAYKDKVYFDIQDTIVSFDGNQSSFYFFEENHSLQFINNNGENLLIGLLCGNREEISEQCPGKVMIGNENGIVKTLDESSNCINRPLDAFQDTNGKMYFVDRWAAYRILRDDFETCEQIEMNSPYNWRANDLYLNGNELWVASEVTTPSKLAFNDIGFYAYIEGSWKNYNRWDYSSIRDEKAYYRIAASPDGEKVYIGSRWNNGLSMLDRTSDEITVFSNEEALMKVSADFPRHRVTGLDFDKQGNLWIANNTVENRGLIVRKPDGTFTDNFKPLSSYLIRTMLIDNEDNIWLGTDDLGVFVYDYNETLDDISDDQVRHINSSNSELPSNQIYSFGLDRTGGVWVGTRYGTAFFECAGLSPNSSCRGSIPRVTVDNQLELLFYEVAIKAIYADAANRKWFGTNSGVFVQSENGTEQLAHYNEDNSPLPSNIINDIVINHESGRVYISTGKGLISLQSDAAGSSPYHEKAAIVAYPNPVRPDYDGPIAIKGFAQDSNIKITDINGRLVYETTALGGQAIWNGRDYNGNKAATGVYLVYATRTSDLENPDAIVTKILFVN